MKKCSLTKCTLREAGVHGFYTGVTESVFSALLALATAPALFFALLTHGASLATIVSQYVGSKNSSIIKNSKTLLTRYCALQSFALFILSLALLVDRTPGQTFASVVCTANFFLFFVGNLASQAWHVSWARAFRGPSRREIVSRRNFTLTAATLISVLSGALALSTVSQRTALILLIALAAAAKLYSALSLFQSEPFVSLHPVEETNVISQPTMFWLPVTNTFAMLYFGIGLSVAVTIPYLTTHLGFNASQILSLGMVGVLGQLVVTGAFCKFHECVTPRFALVASICVLSICPIVSCLVTAPISWHFLFLINGAAIGAVIMASHFLIQSPGSPSTVVNRLSSIVISCTLAQLTGGLIGTILFAGLSHTHERAYLALFLISACMRSLALVFPKSLDDLEDGSETIDTKDIKLAA